MLGYEETKTEHDNRKNIIVSVQFVSCSFSVFGTFRFSGALNYEGAEIEINKTESTEFRSFPFFLRLFSDVIFETCRFGGVLNYEG